MYVVGGIEQEIKEAGERYFRACLVSPHIRQFQVGFVCSGAQAQRLT